MSASTLDPTSVPPFVARAKEHTVMLPRPLLGAALVAMAMLYFTADRFAGLFLLGGLLFASQLTYRRLSGGWALGIALRCVALAAIGATIGLPRTDLSRWYIKSEYTNPLGCLLAVELTLRCWYYAAPSRRRPFVVVALVLTCLIFTCGIDTYDVDWAQRLTPLFVVLIALSLRSINRMDLPTAPAPETKKRRTPRWIPEVLRAAVLAGALATGFYGISLVNRLNDSFDSLIIRFSSHARRFSSSVGVSDAPHLEATFGVNDSTARVLLIDGTASDLYLRYAAFETFVDNKWSPTVANRTFNLVPEGQLRGLRGGRHITITRLANVSDMLLLPLDCNGLDAVGPLMADEDGGVQDKATITNLPYDVTLAPPVPQQQKFFPHQGPLCGTLADTTRQKLLALPPSLDPGVVTLARQVAGNGDAWTRALRLKMYLTSHHQYSLHFEPQGDPLNDFILNNRAAHCQYFASALSIMCRAVGIPSRYVTGYYAHEKYGFGQMIVRSRDAHAWAEVFIDGAGWATLDATPASGLPESLYPPVSEFTQIWERISDVPRALRVWLTTRTQKQFIVLAAEVCIWLAGLWLVQHVWRRLRSRKTRRIGKSGDLLEATALRFDRWLARHGIACPAGATWRDCVSALPPDRLAGRQSQATEFLNAYDAARFGPESLAEQVRPRVTALLDSLEQSDAHTKVKAYARN